MFLVPVKGKKLRGRNKNIGQRDKTKSKVVKCHEDKSFVIVPAFIQLIARNDYVVEYIKRLKNGKKMRQHTAEFDRLCQLISNPSLITDEMIFDILHRICNDYDSSIEENNNPIWTIFQDDNKDQILQVTALMLRSTSTSFSSKMAASGGYNLDTFLPTAAIMHLKNLLSLVWQPVLLEFNKTKGNPSAQLETYKNVPQEIFDLIRENVLPQKRKMKAFKVWGILPRYRAWALLSIKDSSTSSVPFCLEPITWKQFEDYVRTIGLHVVDYFQLAMKSTISSAVNVIIFYS